MPCSARTRAGGAGAGPLGRGAEHRRRALAGVLLVGATDGPFEGDPGDVRAGEGDVAEALAAARELLPADVLSPERVLSSFAGLRVLPPGDGRTSRAPRSHVVSVGPAGLVSVRREADDPQGIAVDALRRLPPDFRPGRSGRRPALTETAAGSSALPDDPELRSHLLGLYGSEAPALAGQGSTQDPFERIHRTGPTSGRRRTGPSSANGR